MEKQIDFTKRPEYPTSFGLKEATEFTLRTVLFQALEQEDYEHAVILRDELAKNELK